MIEEYMRLTNLAFNRKVDVPPVFLLDEIQKLCVDTEEVSMLRIGDSLKHHTLLTLLLTRLSFGDRKPICICAGTNDGNIFDITDTSSLSPKILRLLPLAKKIEYTSFWEEMTRIENEARPSSPDVIFKNADGSISEVHLFNALVYASYQVPRLLYLAHEHWYDFKVSQKKHTEKVLMDFVESAQTYYNEMAEIWEKYTAYEIAHIALSCGVHMQVDIKSDPVVPGTSITWKELIDSALVFPYLDQCFVFPFQLVWNPTDSTILSKKAVVYKKREEVKKICADRVKNLDLDILFVSYDVLCSLQIYDIGIWFESLFVSSLAVKFYLHSKVNDVGLVGFTEIYDIGGAESESVKNILAPYQVDFSDGISLPDQEAFVNKNSRGTSIIHNKKINQAHHDAIISAVKAGVRADIAVQAKASFDLDSTTKIDDQIKISKDANALPVPLLIWLYLGSTHKEEKHEGKPVVFLNGSGCCNGLTLDKFILLKRLRSPRVARHEHGLVVSSISQTHQAHQS
jgi:hypothetical protein